MKIQKKSTLNDPTNTSDQNLYRNIDGDLTQIVQAINGNIRFGIGTSDTNGENISGQWLTIVTSGTANSASSFNHSMGAVPIGYIVTNINKGAVIYASGTSSFTLTTVNLSSTVAGTTATIFLLR